MLDRQIRRALTVALPIPTGGRLAIIRSATCRLPGVMPCVDVMYLPQAPEHSSCVTSATSSLGHVTWMQAHRESVSCLLIWNSGADVQQGKP